MTPSEKYQRAHDLHYYECNIEEAIPLYQEIVAKHADTEPAQWARSQLENVETYTPLELARYSKQARPMYDPARGQSFPQYDELSSPDSGYPSGQSILSRITDTESRLHQSSNRSQALVIALGAPIVICLLGYGIMLLIFEGHLSLEESWLGWLLVVTVIMVFEWMWLRAPTQK